MGAWRCIPRHDHVLHRRVTGGVPPRPYRVAVLTTGAITVPIMEGVRDGLAQLGYSEGNAITFTVEDTHGEVVNLDHQLASILAAKPDVLFTIGTATTVAAKHATTTVPIVFTFVGDPVRSGLVASYASSKNNLTGVSNYSGPLAGKRLEILQEIAPGMKRVLLLVAPQEIVSEVSFQVLAEVAPKLGLEFVRQDVNSRMDNRAGTPDLAQRSCGRDLPGPLEPFGRPC
jgi:putative ABC transport system substrate-binding protein